MCTLAPRGALSFDATAGALPFLKRQRGVAAVALAAVGKMAQEAARHVADLSKDPVRALQPLQERMESEVDAVHRLLKKAVLLSRDPGKGGPVPTCMDDARFLAAEPRPEAPMEMAAKRRKISPSKPPPEVAQQSTEPKKQRLITNPIAEAKKRKMSPPEVVAPQSTEPQKQLQVQRRAAPLKSTPPMTDVIADAKKALKKRRLEEIARLREKARQELLQVERAARPDEPIHQRDLEELGIAGFEYVVTRTRKQARRRLR